MRCLPIKRLVLALFLGVLLQLSFPARVASAKPAQQPGNSGNTISLNATSTVGTCFTVEAVLLPRKPAATMFGGYVADNYAVVKTSLSNHCADQQFILHDIYFDYREWALSGVYAELCPIQPGAPSPMAPERTTEAAPGGDTQAGNSPGQPVSTHPSTSAANTDESTSQCAYVSPGDPNNQNTTGSHAGQVATVGALDIQGQLTEDSVFSRRNLVVNGLTLVGQVAGGYAFVGSMAAVQGIGAFNSVFVPSLSKFWPNRSLNQEKFLLSLGYRTDQITAIAKEGHGSYYVFFPLATFLTPRLKKLFLDDPAVFLNPAEAWLEPNALDVSQQTVRRR